ncbi:DNA-3-methyladenine glycosylase I [Halodesulfovibrio spirochaetisodalis]|uniref:DNA-3-methyladenine glycosylase I n=1 Tax=Halodesulfovibrio spirochaetisodalis TaxID=1560234 RepID=A0A1B7X9K0_9BACT|nr:DNA-3-methyladenine glycosylase I [Halodesulfovibrio spirochaetisodalis]OBQ46053.1 DNA-3-methyladenine glycosylase [Halodesulfovibrio spirochaetisodalis]
MKRCNWVESDAVNIPYHDEEWGVLVHDDRHLFEMLILEGAQAGLSWTTILKKREAYRDAFDNFDAEKIATYSDGKVQQLLQNAGIVRNKLKINAAIVNATCFLEVQKEYGSFDAYIWSFVGGKPIMNAWQTMDELPATSPESIEMSNSLRKKGFKFVGPTICYAYMQAVGMVNDHLVSCFRYEAVKALQT